ncbi:SEN34 subunit of tRNA-splicing endonuclease [Lophiostoma macrostomum CBS 122681]|uniref:tRNA-splicing endonuclease subunit Sen34 n=1 Tax=Lophiostoma macrostomum CBS 122681 TaxID=1314788 RepID=A0A6A6SWJ9_9PLEO|nr:SEN34 subunit of tRNA-splicing endonuclease [Lophiostoma macrostomum CBS 122681]
MATTSGTVTEPFPISRVLNRFLLFDVDAISHARRAHNICGVLIGTIPNLSQQNVFLGVPLELMPEEARVLVEEGHAYIVDDVDVHQRGFTEMSREVRLQFVREMDEQGMQKAVENRNRLEENSRQALKKKGLNIKDKIAGKSSSPDPRAVSGGSVEGNPAKEGKEEEHGVGEDGEALFDQPRATVVPPPAKKLDKHYITPATSYPPLSAPSPPSPAFSPPSDLNLPTVPRSYPLFRYMHSHGYFSMPGLRFGCHYSIYPGDPLRFHSHFLATGMGWDEEFELLDIVGGGRLGTGVKKAYLIGGEDISLKGTSGEILGEADEKDAETVRPFCIEWAGF